MSAPSRWGSLLSQAVAGVESRLDNMLTEADDEAQLAARSKPAKPSPANSRSASSARANDRLQARLAKAVASKSTAAPVDGLDSTSPRVSVDQASQSSIERPSTPLETSVPEPVESSPIRRERSSPPDDPVASGAAQEPQLAVEREHDAESGRWQTNPSKELEEAKLLHQEEVREYVEQIDSLQSKVQYLSRITADSAMQAAASAASGSIERKLAEKDEKIALLMEEGQKLSSSEQTFRATIKKLRLQATENEKQLVELRKDKDKTMSEVASLRSRLNGAEQPEKSTKAVATLQRDINSLKKANAAKDEDCRRLEQEFKLKGEQAETLSKALAVEEEKQRELQDTVATLEADKEALVNKARREGIEWREKLERAVERSRVMEEELRLELRSMESKLEAMRAAAEEASSMSAGEAQVNMFRQMETLQSQYASARENWQGIESSLLAKAANLERERDEAQRRESEMRKKARDAATHGRRIEDELHDAQATLAASRQELGQELEACREQLVSLKASARAAEEALEQARADLEKERQRAANRDRDDAVEADRRRWVDDVAGATSRGAHQSRPDSPLLPVASRTFSSELVGLPTPSKLRRIPTPVGSIPDSSAELVSSMRRLSSQPPVRHNAVPTLNSGPPPPPVPFSPFELPGEAPHMPSPTAERENGVDDTAPSSPRNLAQDMISASTVAAGPSVQLVERMSAAIRRLEAEKVAAKEEMVRVCSQRDEARADMVTIIKELEGAKTAARRVPQLESDVASLDSRYQTTLEMLGEKSELVEELRADVQDVKAMYRELVERTVK
ncbi:hypothetical protein XA68_13807 [Ophiocordyceps unilateralis]|uniref:TATA element modulatory factor 1 TATA binding domain-containing protein n=1 Tax=Ophiocordyceps unilateralis TaxID=268505 RepID=A0A2A9PUB4_OPHUN|nr:hypothetical protein XA68_13807 [Ophiocordyceps unilateralis]